jgi:hypothetical protein
VGLLVQGWFKDDASTHSANWYLPTIRPACGRRHLVNPISETVLDRGSFKSCLLNIGLWG